MFCLPVDGPPFAETIQFPAPLCPANPRGMGQFENASFANEESRIVEDITSPAEQTGFEKIKFAWLALPRGCEGAGVSIAAFVSLSARVIMRMHHRRLGAVHDFVALRARLAGVLIVLRVLQFLEETALAPNVFADAAADHAEEMVPGS